MKHRNSSNRVSFNTIEKAVKGDPIAINAIVEHYKGYILKLSTITFDECDNRYGCIDDEMRRQLQTKLITKILKFRLE